MYDSVPTRAERAAAVLTVAAAISMLGFAALGYGIPAVVCLFLAFTCGTIAKARVDLDSLLAFELREVPDDDPAARRYRERRRQEETQIEERVERVDSWAESNPRLERAFLLGVGLVGVGALAAVPLVADGNSRLAGRLLIVALVGINAALIGYAASHVGTDGSEGR